MSEKAPGGKNGNQRYNIRVLDRAFQILKLMSDGKPRTLHELSEAIPLNPSTTFRMLNSLAYYEYLRRDTKSGRYQLGLTCLDLARAYQDSNDLRTVAIPDLEALRDEIKETVHLAILDQMNVVYLEKLPGLHAIGLMGSRVGGRSPAHCTGLGKVLLAYLDTRVVQSYIEDTQLTRYTNTTLAGQAELLAHLAKVREQGYATDNGEHEPEVRCIAAPIYDHTGSVIAALSVAGPSARMDPIESNTKMIERTKLTASEISAKLGYRPHTTSNSASEEKKDAQGH